jgi:predicted alpha/beta hydrolase family esterase
MTTHRPHAPRLLISPGLHNSGPMHWQSWLQGLHPTAVRVEQKRWSEPALERWAERLISTVERHAHGSDLPWVVAAHSFGCLALARAVALRPDLPIAAALLVAPADPDRFGLAEALPHSALPLSTTMVTSDTDPWMRPAQARLWAQRWRSHTVNLGDAGHINAEAGFGPWPYAQHWVAMASQRLERERRWQRASFAEWSFAV